MILGEGLLYLDKYSWGGLGRGAMGVWRDPRGRNKAVFQHPALR